MGNRQEINQQHKQGHQCLNYQIRKKIIAISYTYMERPDKTKNHEKALYPDIEIHKTFKDFLNGNDRIMEYIINENEK